MSKKISAKKKQNMVIAIGWAVIIMAGVGYFLYQNTSTKGSSLSQKSGVEQVTDEGVTWLPGPQEIQIQEQLFTPDWDEIGPVGIGDTDREKIKVRYFKVGDDNGKDIIIAQLPAVDPSGDRFVTVLHDADKYKIILSLSDTSLNGVYNGPKYNEAMVQEEYGQSYHSIVPPEPLILPEGVLVRLSGRYSGRYFFRDYEKGDTTYPETLEKVATTAWGDLYSHATDQQDAAGTTVKIQQFVLHLPNGAAIPYQSKLQFVQDDNVPLITWSDGMKNKDVYAWNSLGGCGASGYVALADPAVTEGLIAVGKTANGETVYGPSDVANSVLRKYYDQLPNGTYYSYDRTTGESSQIPITIEEYAKKHGIFIYKDGFGRLIIFVNQAFGNGAECGKPVIYLYPTETTSVAVSVGANVTTSEPDYNNGWSVTAHPDGRLTNADGKSYTSLFWEGTGHGTYPLIDSGFIVPQEELEQTLWDHIEKLGLNTQEAKEFMEFWLPHMPQTPYVRLTWFGTRQMNELAPLSITPKPDTTIRLFLDFEGLEKQITLPTQQLSVPSRAGFTVVEWGGLLKKGNK